MISHAAYFALLPATCYDLLQTGRFSMSTPMTDFDETTDILIVGAGPIGIELAIALQRAGRSYLLIEAKQIGDAFSNWPPSTHFFSTPEHVALAGVPVHNVDQLPITGEQYLAYLRTLVEMFDLNLRLYEPVTAVTPPVRRLHRSNRAADRSQDLSGAHSRAGQRRHGAATYAGHPRRRPAPCQPSVPRPTSLLSPPRAGRRWTQFGRGSGPALLARRRRTSNAELSRC